MKNKMSYICGFITIVFMCFIVVSAQSQTLSGDEIIKRVDKNKIYEKIEYNGKMTIKKS
ncbi:MAG: Outer rane lipoproteinsorting protein, partial [Candidatus Poribacteria bacterium]|nr:Outer rane lipoproteinsorting protein [Candidatus Poribacteria bacterium]